VLTQAWAGTFCTELLAFLGADVIQVEVRRRLDSWRGSYDLPMPANLRDVATAKHAWNCNPLYNSVNLGKRCLTLDLQDPRGLAVFKRLVPHADFIAENFSPRVLGNLGLGYEQLARIRADVILCSLSAYGHTGPWANIPGIGGTIEPTSGMSALLGYEDGPPLNSGQMYPDAASGLLGAAAIAAALYHRARTGEGQYIDLSMQEACLAFIGDAALEYAATGVQPPRAGNRHPAHAPHGIFACADGGWVALACEDGTQWRSLCSLVDGLDPSLDRAARKASEPAIERQLAAWLGSRDRDHAVADLLRAGVAAAPVLGASEVRELAHFRERGVVLEVEHPEAGRRAQVASPFHFGRAKAAPPRPSPCLGEHSREVLRELLGMGDAEYEELAAAGVTGEGPPD
jgi:crotonobetainyl-CoA:carnitine CoA-transferase CaiB-like acyl-CoA transferase